MSCHSLSSPGVQLPTGTERPRSHPRWHQPGDQSPGGHPFREAEAGQRPEWVLLGEELPLSQHHQRRDRPHYHLPLQGVWQVRAIGPGTESEFVMNNCSVETGPRWSEVSSARKKNPVFPNTPSYHPCSLHGASGWVDLVSDSEYGHSDILMPNKDRRLQGKPLVTKTSLLFKKWWVGLCSHSIPSHPNHVHKCCSPCIPAEWFEAGSETPSRNYPPTAGPVLCLGQTSLTDCYTLRCHLKTGPQIFSTWMHQAGTTNGWGWLRR